MVTLFRRYTDLAATIHLLREKSITLLNPATWDDKNDAYFMAEYKRHKKAKTLLALCFAECKETYHHWKVYSHGSGGVCIQFNKETLLLTFDTDPRIKMDYVKYKPIKEVGQLKSIGVEELPFLKRYPYEDEREFQIIYVSSEEATEYEDYSIEIRWIQRITLSPWMSRTLSHSVRDTLREIRGCSNLKIARSTLVDNDAWKKLAGRVRA